MPRSIPRPLPECAYPDCGRTLSSHKNTYCKEHRYIKMSASAKIRANTPEGKARMSKAAKAQIVNPFEGCTHTEATKAIIREKRALQVITAESIEKGRAKLQSHPGWNKGGTIPQERKDQISATLLSMHDHLSQKGKERYDRETDDQRANRLNNWIQAGQDTIGHFFANTSIEVFVAQYLDSLGIEYETQKKISYYIVDFFIPSRKIILEANGCYWHGCLLCGGHDTDWHASQRRHDEKRTERLQHKGYTVIILWEHDIRKAMQDSTYSLHLNL